MQTLPPGGAEPKKEKAARRPPFRYVSEWSATSLDWNKLRFLAPALVVDVHDHQPERRGQRRFRGVDRDRVAGVRRARLHRGESAVAARARPRVVLRRAGD